MKEALILTGLLGILLFSCQPDNEDKTEVQTEKVEVKTVQDQIKSIRSKPYNELTDDEKALLVIILESDRQHKEKLDQLGQ
jgi:hypothetical protein